MQDALTEMREAADKLVTAEQASVKPGDFYLHIDPRHNLVVYGEILDAAKGVLDGRELDELSAEEKGDYHHVRALYAAPEKKHFRYARAHSPPESRWRARRHSRFDNRRASDRAPVQGRNASQLAARAGSGYGDASQMVKGDNGTE